VEEVLAALAADADVLACLHLALAALLTAGWQLVRACAPRAVRAGVVAAGRVTGFARAALPVAVTGGVSERGPPARA